MFRNRKHLWHHQQNVHKSHISLCKDPWSDGITKRPWMDERNNLIDEQLQKVYNTHKPIILRKHEKHSDKSGKKIKFYYNFPVKGTDDVNFTKQLHEIFCDQKQSFKVNLSFGVILQHIVSNEYRYFVPYSNSEVFERPQTISNASNISKISKLLQKFSIDEQVLLQRPNTKWKPVLLTNITYSVYTTSFPLGSEKQLSPKWLRNKKSVVTLEYGKGNLCAFRCLAYHQSKTKRVNNRFEKKTKELFKKWCQHKRLNNISNFKGILLPDDIPEFEDVFQINVNIYEFDPVRTYAKPLYLSKAHSKTYTRHESTMNLNCYKNHLTYITNISAYTRKYKCRHCDQMFPRLDKLKRHEMKPCWKKTIFKYPGGYYSPPKTLFDRLKDIAVIDVAMDLQCYDWFVMIDFEALLLEVSEKSGNDTVWTDKHHPISVSICSNVPDYDSPRCFVNGTIEKLLSDMINYLTEISNIAKELTKKKLSEVFSRLENIINYWGSLCERTDNTEETSDVMKNRLSKPNVFRRMMKNVVSFDPVDERKVELDIHFNDWEDIEEEDMNDDDESVNVKYSALKMYNSLLKLRTDLDSFCGQLPVLGFNSSRYDLNLIKTHFASALGLVEQSSGFIIKKNNQYLCISTPKFRFLDISQYLPPGTSYNGFLRTFKVPQEKGFFCYDYLNNPEKLNEKQLPPIQAFWSKLKNRNVLEDERYEEYDRLCGKLIGKNEEYILREMNLKQAPKSKESNYNYLKLIWEKEKMRTLKDLLVWYNNLDVGPGVEGIKRLKQFYWEEMSVDIFKDAISVSGIARKLLFQMAKEKGFVFASIDNSEIYMNASKLIL